MENKGFQSCKCETTDESETRGDCKAQVWQRLARFLQLCVCACRERERESRQEWLKAGSFSLVPVSICIYATVSVCACMRCRSLLLNHSADE
jgi:hypothetical protein